MTPITTESNPTTYHFGQLGRRQVADFSGGHITSDSGLALIAQKPPASTVACATP